ncbi:MAG: translation initiation factor IF-2 [Candidatus Magasanikbacteria bacterium]|nr:translation initiation factor IF-2 [Candidatus Magasanikbacteria bacterium]
MNVSELARQLKINTKDLLEILPVYGFDVGLKAVKIDDRVAEQITRKWRFIRRDLEEKKRKEQEEAKKKERALRKESGQSVILPNLITVRDFAERMNLPTTQVIMELMKNGILANQNQNIDFDTASIIAEELGFGVMREDGSAKQEDIDKEASRVQDLEEALSRGVGTTRPPVVVVMGHVDHGKTKLLDTIRSTNIMAKEAGGITQHIGAYQTVWKDPKTKVERAISFIDTPGHEAFSMMRSRGAKVADIAILVVAADDSVKPQTDEAINIIRAAKLPFVVAINKIDKEAADLDRVKNDLAQRNIIPEEWGGDVPVVGISAKNNVNIDKLLDVLLLVADVNEDKIKADPTQAAVGTIIESNVHKGMGPVATVLVQSGTLHNGDKLVVNNEIYGKVRAMKNYRGETITEATPSTPVQIIGFKVAPEVGDVLDVSKADIATEIDVKQKRSEQTGAERTSISEGQTMDEEHAKKTLNLVIKSDVLGSLEAIIASLAKIIHEEVAVHIIGKGLGNITENDVTKAETANAVIVGFNVRPTPMAQQMIRDKNLTFTNYTVIYDLINWVKAELEKMLEKEHIITELGTMNVLAIFRKEKTSAIVGGVVTNGKVQKNETVRIKREGLMIATGTVVAVKIGQQEVKDAFEGTECGVQISTKEKIEVGDKLEIFHEEIKVRKIVF